MLQVWSLSGLPVALKFTWHNFSSTPYYIKQPSLFPSLPIFALLKVWIHGGCEKKKTFFFYLRQSFAMCLPHKFTAKWWWKYDCDDYWSTPVFENINSARKEVQFNRKHIQTAVQVLNHHTSPSCLEKKRKQTVDSNSKSSFVNIHPVYSETFQFYLTPSSPPASDMTVRS